MNWTADQQKAITQNGSDILVSAAAGSGKTAVLVERIIRKLLDEKNPMDIDRMLVVTFTEAAASEMKEKIVRALQNSGTERARMQLKLIGGADITTIDAFCLRCVRNNFHNIGIDPNFGICDKAEAELLKEEACETLFNGLYASEDEEEKERFIRITRMYSSNRNDYPLRELILCVYRFIQSFAEPEKWLDEKAAMYDTSDGKFFESVWVRDITEACKSTGEAYEKKYARLLEDMAAQYGINAPYDELVRDFPICSGDGHSMFEVWGKLWNAVILAKTAAQRLYASCDGSESLREMFDAAYIACGECFTSSYFPTFKKTKAVSENESWDSFGSRYRALTKEFKKAAQLVPTDADCTERQFAELSQTVNDIVWLVKKFTGIYMPMKEKKNAYEFSDVEHMTHTLFQIEDIQNVYRDKYDEILIDEYQDTNGLQDSIFRLISKNNIFMVGDLKQSIYRFRGGDPFIFKEKNARYSNGDGGVKIALSENFRSRLEILRSVNSVFGCVMSDSVGDVVYEGGERLNRINDYYTENGCNHKSEFHLIPILRDSDDSAENSENSEITETVNAQAEAAYIAKEIKRLIDEKYQVMSGTDENGAPVYRDIKSRDIAILSSSVRNVGDIYTEELAKQGISAYIESEGYFDRREISLMLSVLSVINNNRQDIPLIAVMRSPIGGFTDNELASIRINSRSGSFYDAVKNNRGLNETLLNKCKAFIKRLDRWRDYMKYKSVAGLLWTLYEETGFYDFMGALEGGEEAQANLRLLYERAKQYEETGFKGLFNFIKYTERIKERSEDIGSAKIIGENHDVVRIMTIHKSKGLEFPVVFVAGAGKRSRTSGGTDSVSRLNLHKDAGFGMMYVNPDESFYSETIAYDYVKKLGIREQQSENLRRLYVALTRPKEKLIVTAVMKFKDENAYQECLEEWKDSVHDGKMDEETAVKASGFYDWLIPAVLNDTQNWEFKSVKGSVMYSEDICDILNYRYPYADCCRLPSKTTVTEMKRMKSSHSGYSADYSMIPKPRFAETAEAANEIGTAHHQIMAYIRLKQGMDEEYILSEAQRIRETGQISAEDEKNINAGFIGGFFRTELGKRMTAAYENGTLMREAPFEISISPKEYDSSVGCDICGDEIIVQGAIDCCFEEDGGFVLTDYKTDRFKGDINDTAAVDGFVESKREEYAVQLDLYKRAIEKITGKTVKEKYLYLFSVNKAVKM